jgi:aspartyl-tRNA(Asn)/glutamyl-tRNA(Gln) amidotransferase subunit C
MKIDDKLLSKLERLSSLSIEDSKKDSLKSELSDIVNFVENLNSIDVDNIQATFTTLDGGTQLREDIVNSSEVSDSILRNAPQIDETFFVVPKIIG